MVLWVEKYRPQSLQTLTLHPHLTATLQQLIHEEDFPHLLLYGPSGGGKKTRIHALLRGLFGKAVDKVKVSHKTFKVKTRNIEISTLGSNYHIEINPSDVGISDRHVVQEVIKEIAQTQNVAQSAHAFKVVVLNEVDRLSLGAQQALRRTMEKYTGSCRLILVCESMSRVIAPLRSRCLAVRVAAPSKEEIATELSRIAAKENLAVQPALALSIAEESGRNLRRAILMMEAAKVKFPQLGGVATSSASGVAAGSGAPVVSALALKADWEQFIDNMGKSICEEQSPQRYNHHWVVKTRRELLRIRGNLYELLTNAIPPDVIMRSLTIVLLRRVDDTIKHEIVQHAAFYDHRMHQGSKAIFHLEAFVAKFMAVYKRWVCESFA